MSGHRRSVSSRRTGTGSYEESLFWNLSPERIIQVAFSVRAGRTESWWLEVVVYQEGGSHRDLHSTGQTLLGTSVYKEDNGLVQMFHTDWALCAFRVNFWPKPGESGQSLLCQCHIIFTFLDQPLVLLAIQSPSSPTRNSHH